MVLRSYLSISAASRSTSKNAFISETKLLVENMLKSMARRLEVGLLYGQAGLGTVESVAVQTIKIEDHEWASGIWSGGEGMPISIFSSDYVSLRGHAVITSVDLVAKTITIDNAVTAAAVVATDVIHYKTAAAVGGTFYEFVGIHKIITNTGTLFNVNAASYNLWKGNTVNVGTNFTGGEATLSFDKIEVGLAQAMAKGLSDEDMTIIVSPLSWKNLLVEQAAKRQYDASYSPEKVEQGSKSIKFYAQNGMIEIISSIFCKEGYAYGLPMKEFIRVGSTDITFEQPGFEGKFLKLVDDYNAYELRAYTDQAVFTSKPGLCILFTFIKN